MTLAGAALGHRPSAAWVSRSTAVTSTSSMPCSAVDVVVEEPVLESEAGVVDQHVDRPLAVGEPVLDPGQLGRVAEVGGQHLHLDAVRRSQLGGDLAQPRLVPGDEHQVVAPGGELDRELVADAGGGSGDERGPAAGSAGGGEESGCSRRKTCRSANRSLHARGQAGRA